MINNVIKKYAAALILVLFFSAPCWAHRHHGAHVHGVANVNIAIDRGDIGVVLTSPAINIIGFEHNPQNEEELGQAQKGIKGMKSGESLFVFSPAAKCELIRVEIETGIELSLHHEDEQHEAGHHEEGKHDAEHHEEGKEAHHGNHSDIDGEYLFSCVNPDKLEQVEIKLFDHFLDLHKVKVQIMNGDTQTGAELTPENNSAAL